MSYWLNSLRHTSRTKSTVVGLVILILMILPFVSPSIRHRVSHELATARQEFPAEKHNRLTERRALWKSAFVEMDRHPISGTSFRGIESRQAIFAKAKFYYPPAQKTKECPQ